MFQKYKYINLFSKGTFWAFLLLLFSVFGSPGLTGVSMAQMSSDNFKIKADSFNTGGGLGSSAHYKTK